MVNLGRTIHGQSDTRLYRIWSSMKMRCTGRGHDRHVREYYEAGIRVCEEWQSFLTFREWSETNGYRDDLEIDRIDVTGNYEPSNCRWVTEVMQIGNTRKRRSGCTSVYKGVSWDARRGVWVMKFRDEVTQLFHDERMAAEAYDSYARNAYGDCARVNFPVPGEQGALR